MSVLRTFGDVPTYMHHHRYVHCSFCKKGASGYKYSTRHYICDACIEPRRDVVLPAVKRREAFNAKLDAARAMAVPK